MPDRQAGETSPKFDSYSYFDKHGNLHTGSATAKQSRRILIVLNTFIVLMAVLVGLGGGFLIGVFGYPIIGTLFAAFILLGSYVQFSRSIMDESVEFGLAYALIVLPPWL